MTQVKKTTVASGEWECMECGYIEEGVQARRPAKCVECNAPSSALEFFAYEEDEEFDRDEDDFDDEEEEYGPDEDEDELDDENDDDN